MSCFDGFPGPGRDEDGYPWETEGDLPWEPERTAKEGERWEPNTDWPEEDAGPEYRLNKRDGDPPNNDDDGDGA